MCVNEQIRQYDGTVNTLHWLFLGCVWYVLDTCWNNILNLKQCSTAGIWVVHGQVKMKNAVIPIAQWTTRTTRMVDFATPDTTIPEELTSLG